MNWLIFGRKTTVSSLAIKTVSLLSMVALILSSDNKDADYKMTKRSAYLPQWPQYHYQPPPPASARPNYSPYQYPKPVYNIPPRIPPRVTPVASYQLHEYAKPKTITPQGFPITNFERKALEYHNEHRLLHGAPKMMLDHGMSEHAALYAKEIIRTGLLRHAPTKTRTNQGENIAIGCRLNPKGMTAFEAVHDWYSTVCHYNFESAGYYEKARPFTKIVWSPYRKFGIGKADFDKGQFRCTILVARYGDFENSTPPGPLDFSRYVKRGFFRPAHCQYYTNKNQLHYIQPPQNPSQRCEAIKEHSGALLHENSYCTLEKLFSLSGLSVRKGKLAFKLLL